MNISNIFSHQDSLVWNQTALVGTVVALGVIGIGVVAFRYLNGNAQGATEAQVKALEDRVNTLESVNQNNTSTIQNLESRLKAFEDQTKILESVNHASTIQNLESRLKSLEDRTKLSMNSPSLQTSSNPLQPPLPISSQTVDDPTKRKIVFCYDRHEVTSYEKFEAILKNLETNQKELIINDLFIYKKDAYLKSADQPIVCLIRSFPFENQELGKYDYQSFEQLTRILPLNRFFFLFLCKRDPQTKHSENLQFQEFFKSPNEIIKRSNVLPEILSNRASTHIVYFKDESYTDDVPNIAELKKAIHHCLEEISTQ